MLTDIIGSYCLFHVIIGEIALWASLIQKDELPDGARARANFITAAFLAIAAWCFK